MIESFFSSLKTDRTAAKRYSTKAQARADVFDYIECFYNTRRRHSTLRYLSPMEFEATASRKGVSSKPAAGHISPRPLEPSQLEPPCSSLSRSEPSR